LIGEGQKEFCVAFLKLRQPEDQQIEANNCQGNPKLQNASAWY